MSYSEKRAMLLSYRINYGHKKFSRHKSRRFAKENNERECHFFCLLCALLVTLIRCHNTHHNNIQHNITQYLFAIVLTVVQLSYIFCCILNMIKLNVVMMSVVMLDVILLSVTTLSVIMLTDTSCHT